MNSRYQANIAVANQVPPVAYRRNISYTPGSHHFYSFWNVIHPKKFNAAELPDICTQSGFWVMGRGMNRVDDERKT